MALNERYIEVSSQARTPNKQMMKTAARRSDGLSDNVILFEVLPWLPAKSLCRFKQVSRLWRDTISADRFFILRQSQRQTCISSGVIFSWPRHHNIGFFPNCGASVGVPDPSLGFPETKMVKIIASAHGLLLLCLLLEWDPFLYICNPATGEGMRIPGGRRGRNCNFALAFDPRASPDRYMLINATFYHFKFHFDIFSSNTGQWTTSSLKPTKLTDYCSPRNPKKVVFAGGVAYWHFGNNILIYDTFEDAAQNTMPPKTSTLPDHYIDEIGVWEEKLTCCRQIEDTMQVWLMIRKNSEWEWEIRHCIPLDGIYCLRPSLFYREWCKYWLLPMPYEGGKNIYMRIKVDVQDGEVKAKDVIVKWDMEAKDAEVIGEMESPRGAWTPSFSYHNSLVALPRFPGIE